MKKNIFGAAIVAAMAAMVFTACNQSSEDSSSQPAAKAGEMRMAYVEIDSIDNQYQFCKDQKAILLKDSAEIASTLQKQQNELQQAANNFQQKAQQNAYTQQQAQQIQAGLQRQAQDLQALQERLMNGFQEKLANYRKAYKEQIEKFLAEYNKDKKYSVIFTKQGMDPFLYADKSLDITKEVIAGLNKSYKPSATPAPAETKTEDKKDEKKDEKAADTKKK